MTAASVHFDERSNFKSHVVYYYGAHTHTIKSQTNIFYG